MEHGRGGEEVACAAARGGYVDGVVLVIVVGVHGSVVPCQGVSVACGEVHLWEDEPVVGCEHADIVDEGCRGVA